MRLQRWRLCCFLQQLAATCCVAALLAVLQLTGAVLLWRARPLTTEDFNAAACGLVVLLIRATGGGIAWMSRGHETRDQKQLRELTLFVRRSGLELPEHLDRSRSSPS
jgi:hypothetical protein